MLTEFVEYILGLKRDFVDGNHVISQYGVKLLQKLYPTISSLSGIIEFCQNNKDGINKDNAMIIIDSYREVSILSKFTDIGYRDCYMKSEYPKESFRYNMYLEQQDFIVGLGTNFKSSESRNDLIKIVSRLSKENSETKEDDGISQKVTIKKSVHRMEEKILPSLIDLFPYCTFSEIEQPVRPFVFRINSEDITMSIFEIKHNIWEIQTIDLIKKYLQEKLPDWSIIG